MAKTKMIKDSTTGKFVGRAPDPDNDWKHERLVWERAYPNPAPAQPEAINAIGVDLELTNDAGERVQIIGLTKRKKAQEWQPTETAPIDAPRATQRAKRGKRSNQCSRCGAEIDNKKSYFCKSCRADYMRERRMK